MEKTHKITWGPSFFKVLLDYTRRLRLPPVFVRDYGEFLHGSAIFRTSWGKTWNVKIEEEIYDDDGDEKYMCFVGGGWRNFVKDSELKIGEFLVFVFNVGESTFNVSVFGTDFCERRVSATAVESDADSGLIEDKLSFTAVMRNYNRFFLDIPKPLAEVTGIAGKRTIKLQNVKGKEWVVELPYMENERSRMSKGWNPFYVENKLVLGSKCLFAFDPASGNLIMKRVGNIWEGGSGRSPESMGVCAKRRTWRAPNGSVIDSTVRGRGRPPKNLLDVKLDSDGDSEFLTVRGRGRGRGRGRTPTNVESDSEGDSESLTGRGRGRPPMNVCVEFDSNGDDDSGFLIGRGRGRRGGMGRGRGRPPTNVCVESDSNGDDEDDSESFTGRGRGRGRPPKNVVDVELDSDGDEDNSEFLTGRGRGRGRGRPLKDFLDVDSDEDDDDSEF